MSKIDQWQLYCRNGVDNLHGLAVDDVEGRAPGFVSAQDLGEALLQNGEIERPIAVDGDRLVVNGNFRGNLRVQPDLLLWKRQRCRPGARAFGNMLLLL